MGVFSGFVVFTMIWWIVFFMVLPTGVRGQWEDGDVVEGTEPGAPQDPQIWRKVKLTTMIAAGVWVVFALLMWSGIVSLDDLWAPFDTTAV